MAGRTSDNEYRHVAINLSELREKEIVQYIIELDDKGFEFQLAGGKDIINHMLKSSRGEICREALNAQILYNDVKNQRRV